jgi:hypothetical protein
LRDDAIFGMRLPADRLPPDVFPANSAITACETSFVVMRNDSRFDAAFHDRRHNLVGIYLQKRGT